MSDDNPENPKFVGIKEAAEFLGVSENTVRAAITREHLPFRLAYGHKVIPRAALADYKSRSQPEGKPQRGRPRKG